MRAIQRFSLPTHGVIEFLAGLAMMLFPAVFAFAVPGVLASLVLGAILTGNAIGLAARAPGSVSAHHHFHSVFLVVTALATLTLAVIGQTGAVVFLAAIVVIQTALGLATRYSALD